MRNGKIYITIENFIPSSSNIYFVIYQFQSLHYRSIESLENSSSVHVYANNSIPNAFPFISYTFVFLRTYLHMYECLNVLLNEYTLLFATNLARAQRVHK